MISAISEQSDNAVPGKVKRLAREINKQIASLGVSKKVFQEINYMSRQFDMNSQLTRSMTGLSLASEKDLDIIVSSDLNEVQGVFMDIFENHQYKADEFVNQLKQV